MKKQILSLILILFAINSFAQTWVTTPTAGGGWVKPNNSYGDIRNRAIADKFLGIPTTSTILDGLALSDTYEMGRAGIAWSTGDNSLYIFNPATHVWEQFSGGSGTLTTISVGDLPPIFTSSVDNTDPANPIINFALSNAAPYSYLGNNTGSSAVPTYNVPTYGRLGDVALSSIADGQLTHWDAGLGKWVNFTPTYGSGTITNVTATAPAYSSGGITPDIRIGTPTGMGLGTSGQVVRTNGTTWEYLTPPWVTTRDRFGFATEDATGAEDRTFTNTTHEVNIIAGGASLESRGSGAQTQIRNTTGLPWLVFKNDAGETSTPSNGAMISGSWGGGAIKIFSNSSGGPNNLQLGVIDNTNAFTSFITMNAYGSGGVIFSRRWQPLYSNASANIAMDGTTAHTYTTINCTGSMTSVTMIATTVAQITNGSIYWIKNSTSGTVTVNPAVASGNTFDGASTYSLAANDAVMLVSDNTNSRWHVLGTYKASAITSLSATAPITYSAGVISTSMSTNKLIGRSTAGTGVMEEITIGTGLSLSAGTLAATGGSGWLLIGNAGTTAGTNFIGTTDAVDLVFKVNNFRSGYIGQTDGSTSFGYRSLQSVGGGNNTAFGYQALTAITTGQNNTAVGDASGASITQGQGNTVVGIGALQSATNSSYNTAVGFGALNASTANFSPVNTAIGANAMNLLTSGNQNVSVGYNTMANTLTTSQNVAIGYQALYGSGTPTGSFNTGVGWSALSSYTSGANNTSLGWQSGATISSGSNNVTLGYNAAVSSGTNVYSIALGSGSSAASNQFAIGANTTKMKFALETDAGTASHMVGEDGSGNWKLYSVPSGGSGEVNTASNLGGGLANYDSKSGVDLRFNTFAAADFDLASNLISIDDTKWLTISAGNAAYQPLDADLTTIAGLTATTDNFIVSVSSAWASRTPAQVRTTLGLVIGTNVEAWDADLDTYAGLTPSTLGQNIITQTNPSAITFPRYNADNTVSALDAATFRTAIGAGTSSFSGAFSSLTGIPTTVAGYGITDVYDKTASDARYFQISNNLSEGTASTMRTNLGLGNVENTALSTWAGSSNITTVGSLSSHSMADGANISLGSTTGTKIGTATTQKLGFFNSTPVVQQSGDIGAMLQTYGLCAGAGFSYNAAALSGTVLSGNLPATIVYTGQTNTYTAGMKQIFQTSATTSGLRLVGVTADPSSPVSGDIWFRSDDGFLRYHDGASVKTIVNTGGVQTFTNKTIDALTNTINNIAAANMTMPAYSFNANNTSSTAAPTSLTYENKGVQTYVGTDTWDGTAPTGASTKQYQWIQTGKEVKLWFWISYATAGATNTTIDLTFPSDLPLPAELGGRTSTNDILYSGVGKMGISTTQQSNTSRYCFIIKTGTGTYKITVAAASASAKTSEGYINYIAQ